MQNEINIAYLLLFKKRIFVTTKDLFGIFIQCEEIYPQNL